ncbi:SIS domain-containing protein [Streptomyces sp. MST-110588]|uniref:SIS domain-containing protein n=1 Tax=Streptomyces sp. MST-110588 TaxID=2833628 RepID=UPI001F5CAEEB|nr:SIS domain-containing protein [Streptomyces sp. MST-110588]UNO43287.1 SIS domain-containing protein [Streptomyces sp. MST-110588]
MTTATLPLKPITEDFKEAVAFALSQNDVTRAFVKEVVDAGLRNVFLIGCGGSLTASYPVHFLLETRAAFPVFQMNSDEFNLRRPALLGEGSLVVVSSHTGTTKETVAAARYARSAGAKVAAISRDADSPLAQAADLALTYRSEDTVVAPKGVLFGQLGHALLEFTGAQGDYAALRTAFEALPDALYTMQEEGEELAHSIATALADEDMTYVLSAGPNYGAGYGFTMCYLMEMQWKHGGSFHAGEFFHGAFEMVTEDQPVILFLGEDATRPMAERAKTFLDTYTRKAHYVDSRIFSLPGVPEAVRGDITPIALDVFVTRLARHYESVRGHDLDQRRYMFRVEY